MNQLKYFKTFRGHSKPLVPVDEIQFSEAESLPTYYASWFEENQKIIRFVKYAVTRFERREFVLKVDRKPGSNVCFIVYDKLNTPIDAAPVNFSKTETETEIYQGVVGDDGKKGYVNRYERTVTFDETYINEKELRHLIDAKFRIPDLVNIKFEDVINQPDIARVLETPNFQLSLEKQVHMYGADHVDKEKAIEVIVS